MIYYLLDIDIDKTYSRSASLSSITEPSVLIREHYAREIEENVRKLLPTRKAALQHKMSVRIIEDKS